ncbi:MAG: hypothetical protein ACRC3G_06210 [Bacteroidales bacterium]
MSSKILFIFEGKNMENMIKNNLTKFFLNNNPIITCAYCTTIYKMYAEISNDEDLDTFNLIKDIEINRNKLKDFRRSDFAEIYMFFDYDGHATNADDRKIDDLLNFFDEETEKGKLYLSYPMVESLKHIESLNTFEDLKVRCKENINYKSIVKDNSLKELTHIIHYELEQWKTLLNLHLKKMNKIVNENYIFPDSIVTQKEIFDKQKEKYIDVDRTVAVLSAFPVFLHDYYGNEETKKLTDN